MAGRVRIRGVQSGGEVINLPTHTFPTDDGGVDLKCPTEIAISDRREAELSKSGLMPLIHRKNTDKAAFIGAQSLYKPKKYDKEEATAVRQPLVAHSLHVRDLALRPLSQMHGARQDRRDEGAVRSCSAGCRAGSTSMSTPTRELDSSNESAQAARRGHASTFSKMRRTPDSTGHGSYLRPHFQLEGMDIGMSLVSRLPGKGRLARDTIPVIQSTQQP